MTSSTAAPATANANSKRLADLATVQWRVLPVTWDEITDTPDDVVDRIMTTLAAWSPSRSG